MKFEFSRESFEKYAYIKFHQNPSNVSRFIYMRAGGRADRQTGRHEEASRCISQFFNTPKNSPGRLMYFTIQPA